MTRIAMALILLCLAGCSTVQTTGGGQAVATRLPSERIQLRVRTGDARLDAMVWQSAYRQFSAVMPLGEQEPYTAALEITFDSMKQTGLVGIPAVIISTPTARGAKAQEWYTGGQAPAADGGKGNLLEWQNSRMSAVLQRSDGVVLWSANYAYNGANESSSWTVHTPEQAARLIIGRLVARFGVDLQK